VGCADEAQTVTFGTTQPGLSPAERSPRAAAGDDPLVTVSLTFDDTEDEQLAAAAVLEAHGLVGTFYVNSPRLHQSSAGADDWLSVADVQAMQQRGHEMGGHTLSHPFLTSLSEPERRREISRDRRDCRGCETHRSA
jgi:peptidoglycan/xylan/chitin deacetylase (PgdA/CDA1 family)